MWRSAADRNRPKDFFWFYFSGVVDMAADLFYIMFLPFAHTHRARGDSGRLSFFPLLLLGYLGGTKVSVGTMENRLLTATREVGFAGEPSPAIQDRGQV
ncbi:hypothetical protein LY76DRAFT_62904 [Colletotrichum caudatum]|nr:hypothetical protein LY76DRAFT_62904 [Colletotrichum caudatum]